MAFRKPATKKLGIKVLSLGKEGTGKTVFALSFPRIASIDGEAGQSFYENTEYGQNLVFVDNTQSYQELEEDIDYIEEEYEAQDIQTLVIDSETKVFNNLEETLMTIEEKKAKKKGVDANDSNLSIRSRGRIKYIAKRLQNLKIDLSSKGVNVVSIAQAKDVQIKQGDSWVVTGVIPDMVKGSAFDYDLVLEHYSEIDAQGNVKYKAKVVKDRTNVFNKGDIVDNPRYQLWASVTEIRKDAEKLDTSFVKESENDKVEYEKQLEEDEKTLVERMATLIKDSEASVKVKIQEALTKAKITSFAGLTTKQQEKLESIYQSFK